MPTAPWRRRYVIKHACGSKTTTRARVPKEIREVGVDDVRVTPEQQLLHVYDCLLGISPGTIGVDFRWESVGETADAEQPVKTRHNGPAVPVLDGNGLRVHRHVDRAVGHSEQPKRDCEQRRTWRQDRQRGCQQHREDCRGRGFPAAKAGSQHAAQRQSHQRAGGQAEERQAEQTIGKTERMLGIGDLRNPAAECRAVGKKYPADGEAREPRPCGRLPGR